LLSCLVVMIVSYISLVERSQRSGSSSPDLQRRAATDRRRGPIDRCRYIRALLSSRSASNSGRGAEVRAVEADPVESTSGREEAWKLKLLIARL
jgi:hypothetical protein